MSAVGSERREALGISQGAIARQLGLTFSQIQKYEKGSNRIGAGRLFMLSQALGVPVQYFFEDDVGAAGSGLRQPGAVRRGEPRDGGSRRGVQSDRRRGDPPVGARSRPVDPEAAGLRDTPAAGVRKLIGALSP